VPFTSRIENIFVKKIDVNIQTEKLDLIEWISRLNDNSVIDKLKQIKEDYKKSGDWWDTLSSRYFQRILKLNLRAIYSWRAGLRGLYFPLLLP
jgi:hypothetical protein